MKKFIVLAVTMFVLMIPSSALASYNHLAVCESTLRGYSGSDDDIHNLGVILGATSFGGWGTYWHASDGSVYVYGRFNFPSYYQWYLGHCWGGDYGPDGF